MAKFAPGVPQTTKVPQVSVDAGLKVGMHRFRLVIVGEVGGESPPDETLVQVVNPHDFGIAPAPRAARSKTHARGSRR